MNPVNENSGLDQNDVCRLQADYQILRPGDLNYSAYKRLNFRNRIHILLLELVNFIRRSCQYGEREIKDRYEPTYANTKGKDITLTGKMNTYYLGDGLLLRANSVDWNQFVAAHLICTVCELASKNVLEIGSGLGRITFAVASRLKNSNITGIELTQSGVAASLRMLADKPSSGGYCDIYGVDFSRIGGNKIDFVCASAKNIPLRDQSYGVVYTSMALEQMNSIADDVMNEIARISSRYIVLFEPFWEANDLLGKLYLIIRGYWKKRIIDMEKRGFRLVSFNSNLPRKLTFQYALAVFERE